MQQALAPREQFPILQQKNYLASHSLGAMPAATPGELQRYTDLWARQGILAWDGEWWDILGEFGGRIEDILHAPSQSVVPCLNVTLGLATVASCLTYTPQRNRVVLCDLEFTTSLPFWLGQQALGAEVVVVPSPDGISLPLDTMKAAIDERTALVVSSHAYFRSGALQEVNQLQAWARHQGALLVVDAYQSVGCVPLDVTAGDFDFVVAGCHKWLCGGPGGGFLYVRPALIAGLEPRLAGWMSLAEPFAYEKNQALHPGHLRFLNGTPNVLGLFAARQGLAWIQRLGLSAIRAHSHQLTGWLWDQLQERGLNVKTPFDPQKRNGMVCVDFPTARACQAELQKREIIVDYRPDCGIRISPHFYNQKSDLEAFLHEFDLIRKELG